MNNVRKKARHIAVAAGIGLTLGALAVPGAASANGDDSDGDYPPDETVVTTPVTHPPTPTTIARTGSDNIGEMLATGAAFGVAGIGMVAVARRRRRPAT